MHSPHDTHDRIGGQYTGPVLPRPGGLYDPRNERDACGVGFVCHIDGTPSHDVIDRGIDILKNLLHRGAAGAGGVGDGAGLMAQIPDRLFREVCAKSGFELPPLGKYGVGMLFLPSDPAQQASCREAVQSTISTEGLTLLGWRETPIDEDVLVESVRATRPSVWQCFVEEGDLEGVALERKLYVLRRECERAVARLATEAAKQTGADAGASDEDWRFYIPSFSCRTIVYKGLLLPTQVATFYADLGDTRFESALAVVHQRYSTNTFPSWELAQPFRYLAHNGEINTLRGNINHMKAREPVLESDLFGADVKKLFPVVDSEGSDSACLDNALELLTTAGRSLHHSMTMLIPQAWGVKYPMGPDLRGFFEYHAGLMEPWDGPAAVVFSDGTKVGALLDRNGLRPARYTITKDGFMVFASEAGVLNLPPSQVRERGSLRPGRMILVDLQEHRVLGDVEIKTQLSRQQPYRRWVEENKVEVHGLFGAVSPASSDHATLLKRQKYFGYTREDLTYVLDPMATTGHEPVGSMGADEPLAVLSEQPQLLYWYFKQLFAQVTNPAIDSIREELVMSLMTFIGDAGNLLTETPQQARLVKLTSPILSIEDLARLRDLDDPDFVSRNLPMGFPAGGSGHDLAAALEKLCDGAEAAVGAGENILILSDRDLPEDQMAIPALLAVSAVSQHLTRVGRRAGVDLIAETGEAREVMHMALLLGYGASAINPYLACEIITDLASRKGLSKDVGETTALELYCKALTTGLLKIMSKLGISTLRSYRGAQAFECLGLNQKLVGEYFAGTASRIEGIGLDEIAAEADARRLAAGGLTTGEADKVLPSGGRYSYRKDGERHLWTPDAITLLQRATRTNDYDLFKKYTSLINDQERQQSTLRGLFAFKKVEPVPLSEVEPESEIVQRFMTGAMSFGSISQEAHETLAIAMNRLGGMSNSGEGGEDPERYVPLPNGDSRCSAIKQIASGRFGVTAEYLVNARELQIKIAQGAKPGEGGQLPASKVYPWVAKTRNSTPYVSLISPPPHHDIYSIEDLEQLIYDLRCINPDSRISVKLVSEVGVGTVAAGVAKGRADVILISGGDGGTGAAPLSSVHYVGAPWELGLAETQQTLVLNGLRDRVRLQADGQMKTGRDVVVAALLGAEEFGFATTALVVLGCIMMRACHKNTCPAGIATQEPDLRSLFTGKPEYVVNFMRMIAREAREFMAQLGIRKVDDLIGRSDLLQVNQAVDFWKAKGLDFSKILHRPDADPKEVRKTTAVKHDLHKTLDRKIVPLVRETLETARPVTVTLPIRNVHRAVGTVVSGNVARHYGGKGLPDDTMTLHFNGSAGQSFGAFCCKGMTLVLDGEANDYMGKGLSGAKIVVKPPSASDLDSTEDIIAGNVALYGATSGEVYIRGQAGERFAIRNSGAWAVVEGIGDHGCEYMTGGRVAVLGPTGVNFAAGMSGGIAYVLDETGLFDDKCNLDMVDLELMTDAQDQAELRTMIERHHRYSGSRRAHLLLESWESYLPHFVKVFPTEYKRALGALSQEDEAVERKEVERD